MEHLSFVTFFTRKKLSLVSIEPAILSSEPILAEMRHFRYFRADEDITNS